MRIFDWPDGAVAIFPSFYTPSELQCKLLVVNVRKKMNIEDLVYKTGPDGKPKKPKRTGQAAIGFRRAGKAASDFAAAVKAEFDAKEACINKTTGLRGSDRLAARLNDAKGQPKVCVALDYFPIHACHCVLLHV